MNFNKVILAGNLTRDVEVSYLPNQTQVGKFGLAINHKWKSSAGEEKQEVCFVDCVAFGGIVGVIQKYTQKGAPLFVEGRLRLEQWNAQDGSKRSKMVVVVDNIQLVSSKTEPKAEEENKGNDETERF